MKNISQKKKKIFIKLNTYKKFSLFFLKMKYDTLYNENLIIRNFN
jgi:hypothetical protein